MKTKKKHQQLRAEQLNDLMTMKLKYVCDFFKYFRLLTKFEHCVLIISK